MITVIVAVCLVSLFLIWLFQHWPDPDVAHILAANTDPGYDADTLAAQIETVELEYLYRLPAAVKRRTP